jgi:hypothetical protein
MMGFGCASTYPHIPVSPCKMDEGDKMNTMKDLLANSYLSGGNAAFIEELYDSYLQDPASVAEEWHG